MEIYTNKKEKILVDEEDYERLKTLTWYINSRGYPQHDARKNGVETRFLMHHYIMKPNRGMEVDHINKDKLDNRKCNLRICTRSENSRNRSKFRKTKSGYKGVYYYPKNCKGRPWQAGIVVNRKYIYLGSYKDKEDAARSYNEGAKKHHKEFACLNKI